MRKKILFVCLGNICRSPAAEAVFLDLIKARNLEANFEVDSAGTGAWHVGNQADSRMRDAASKRGIIITSRARKITPEDLVYYDLILTMDSDNLDNVNSLAQGLAGNKIAIIKQVMSYACQYSEVDVPDPYYGGEKGFERVLDLLSDACNGLLEAIS